MRYKTIALMLALAVAAWAQTTSSNPPATTAATEKAKCACCEKMASAKDGQSCARNMAQSKDGKQTMSCCGDKNKKSCCAEDAHCMNGDKASCCSDDNKDKTASSSCGSNCGKKCGKGCCSGKTEKASRSCCKKALQS